MTIPTPSVAATGVAVANQTGQFAVATVTGGTVQGILVTPQVAVPLVTPSVPASTVQVVNTTQNPVAVAVAGGTVTHITVSGSDQATATNFTAVVPAGGNIAITYSVVPTWTWTQLLAGVAGSPIASPYSVPLFPGCYVAVNYTVAPTWAWINPLNEGYTPSPAAMNQLAESSGYNPYTVLPWAQHATLSQTGLATGVSN